MGFAERLRQRSANSGPSNSPRPGPIGGVGSDLGGILGPQIADAELREAAGAAAAAIRLSPACPHSHAHNYYQARACTLA